MWTSRSPQGEAAPDHCAAHCFELLPTVLHELGHVLGLSHSAEPNAVMYGYYTPGRISLHASDAAAAAAALGARAAPAGPSIFKNACCAARKC